MPLVLLCSAAPAAVVARSTTASSFRRLVGVAHSRAAYFTAFYACLPLLLPSNLCFCLFTTFFGLAHILSTYLRLIFPPSYIPVRNCLVTAYARLTTSTAITRVFDSILFLSKLTNQARVIGANGSGSNQGSRLLTIRNISISVKMSINNAIVIR
jgi:hypothetical protein